MFKRYFTTAFAAAMLLTASAQAEAPTSQFGFTVWPHRQPTACQEDAIPTFAPEITPIQGENDPIATIAPTNQPAVSTSEVTAAPALTIFPTQPSQPTVSPTAKPTAIPTVTKVPSSVDDYTTDSIVMQEQSAWNLLNADRISNGLAALPLDAELSRIARIKCQDMRDQGYFAHQSPTYGTATQMLQAFGYAFTAAGENIAHHATVEKSQAAFMSSQNHRRNILSIAWTRVGIGVCYDAQGYVYVTQLFAR